MLGMNQAIKAMGLNKEKNRGSRSSKLAKKKDMFEPSLLRSMFYNQFGSPLFNKILFI
jgi:hypothetical protein